MKGRLVLTAALLPLALAACGGSGGSTSTATPTEPQPPPLPPSTATETTPLPIPLQVYFLRDGKVAAARRDVAAIDAVGTAAVRAMLKGPTDEERQAGLTTAFPAGTELTSLAIANGIATAELSRSLDTAALAQLTYTLTQFPTVRSVKVDGRTETRAKLEPLTPAILVEFPVVGDTVTSPLRVSGTANTFEATFQLEVRTRGRLIEKRFVTASSGSGTRGTFSERVPFTVSEETPAELIVYELSAANGKRINTVRVPIGLLPQG